MHTPLAAPERFEQMYNGSVSNKARRTFSADVSALDEFVRNTTAALEARGLTEADYTFIFTTDNGGNLHGGGNNW